MTEHYKSLSEFLDQTGTRLEDFAARIGVGAPYISLLANGRRTPSLPLALRIAAAAQVPIESLLPTRRGERRRDADRRRRADRRRDACARTEAQTAEEGA